MLKIESKTLGAELISIKLNGIEKLHQGSTVLDDKGNIYWGRHAPVLFPIVGKLKDNYTIIDGKKFEMGQHGFARDMEFEELRKDENVHEYLLKSNDKTLQKFPYKFELYIKYVVNGDSLTVVYTVRNVDNRKIKFGIGGHPAFKLDENTNNYLEFERKEKNIKFLQLEDGIISDRNEFVRSRLKYGNIIELNKDTFEKDAIIMENIDSNIISLFSNGKKILDFNFSEFPKLAVWSKVNAPFVCIEPWFTTADSYDSDNIFDNKKGNISLEENKEFKCKYTVRFYN